MTLKISTEANNAEIEATRIGYDLLFQLAANFVGAGITTLLDMNMGWAPMATPRRNHRPTPAGCVVTHYRVGLLNEITRHDLLHSLYNTPAIARSRKAPEAS